jgi:hypothetical protein
MKTLLKISLWLNLGLTSGLVYLLLAGPKQAAAPVPQPASETRPVANEPIPAAPPAPVPAAPKPFRWSQLDAKDYHLYVQNLRAIGCPEPTLRAIVSADVNAVFRRYSLDLKHKLSDMAEASWSVRLANVDYEQALKSQLQQLPGEEVAEIDDLLGLKPAAVETPATMASASRSLRGNNALVANQTPSQTAANPAAANPGAGTDSNPNPATTGASGQTASAFPPVASYQLPPVPKSAALPLIFQPLDPVAMNLNESQMQTVNTLRQQFVNAIGSTSQNPNDPAYQQTWQQAQSQADQQSVVYLGYNPYMALWEQQYQQSLAGQVSSAQ